LAIFGSLREEGDDEDNEFSGLLMKVMKGVDEDDEFFLSLMMNLINFWI